MLFEKTLRRDPFTG